MYSNNILQGKYISCAKFCWVLFSSGFTIRIAEERINKDEEN